LATARGFPPSRSRHPLTRLVGELELDRPPRLLGRALPDGATSATVNFAACCRWSGRTEPDPAREFGLPTHAWASMAASAHLLALQAGLREGCAIEDVLLCVCHEYPPLDRLVYCVFELAICVGIRWNFAKDGSRTFEWPHRPSLSVIKLQQNTRGICGNNWSFFLDIKIKGLTPSTR
jgi:hypothetical protein